LKNLNQKIKDSGSIQNTLDLIEKVSETTEVSLLGSVDIELLFTDIRRSKIKSIDKMCNKRLKDLYFNNDDLSQLNGFVKIMESVL